MQWLSLLVPIAYLGILIGSMATFSYLYRQRQVTAKLKLAPYFAPHQARNIYLSLMHLPEQENTKVPDSVLRAALLARAVEDIRRIIEIRTKKPALAQLLQRGVVGDEVFQRLQRAEQDLEIELKDVVAEANALAPGWGQTIFQSAGEMMQNKILKEKLDGVKTTIPKEIEAWEAQREQSRKELEGEVSKDQLDKKKPIQPQTQTQPQSQPQQEQQPQPEFPTDTLAAIPPQTPEKTQKVTSSDEDAVLVETPGAETPDPLGSVAGGGGGGGKNKKKKNKK